MGSQRPWDREGHVSVQRPELEGDELRQVADFWAARLCLTLGLECCVLYLYDAQRENLIEVGRHGPAFEHRRTIPLALGASLGDLEITPGEPGGSLSLPLWDSRRLVGVAYGRMPPGQAFDPTRLTVGRESALGAAVSLSQRMARQIGRTAPRQTEVDRNMPPVAEGVRWPPLLRYLEGQVASLAPDEPLTLALLSFRGQGGPDRIPARGWALRGCGLERGGQGRGFGFGPASSRLCVVYPRTGRDASRALFNRLGDGSLAFYHLFVRSPGPRADESADVFPTLRAAAFAVYPEDATDPSTLITAVRELFDLQVYLRAIRDEERRGKAPDLDIEPAAVVMDSCHLAAEIDKLRQVLAEQIESGHGFQDPPVRQTSERLDRLIVAMQRLMGHRGAVP